MSCDVGQVQQIHQSSIKNSEKIVKVGDKERDDDTCKILAEQSFLSSEGLSIDIGSITPPDITTMSDLTEALKLEFSHDRNFNERKIYIEALLARVNLRTSEVSPFVFWDSTKTYTRNLIYQQPGQFTLLLLCWNPGCESKIHNHPCHGCYIKTISGVIREVQYHVDGDDIMPKRTKFFTEGQVSFMCDDIGLHKVGNPCKDTGSISMHLYSPPFSSCLTYSREGAGGMRTAEEVRVKKERQN